MTRPVRKRPKPGSSTARSRPKAVRAKAASRKRRAAASRKAEPVKPVRWNPDPEDVQRSVVKLVLSLVELIRKLMERQAVRRFDAGTLTPEEVENVGFALMRLEETVGQLARQFKLSPEELNLELDLGPLGKLH